MPVISPSSYVAPFGFSNPHIQSIFPSLYRKVEGVVYQRERIRTADNDFLDLDRSTVGSKKIAIVSHGLEGNTSRVYMLGMVRALNRHGWDALAWNFRGCSGETNRKLYSYHSGKTDDLHTVITHVLSRYPYFELALIGFSMGGNIILKYLGDKREEVSPLIRKAVAFSVPCDLASGAERFTEWSNKIYMIRFLRMLHKKIINKKKLFPDQIDDQGYHRIKNFKDFDDRYTAPIHGFKNAEDYWKKCSSGPILRNILIPTLLVNARNDPFLGETCYPVKEAELNPNFFLEIPESGGHVGFVTFNQNGEYWSETRAISFIQNF
jgi:hypothetical protein